MEEKSAETQGAWVAVDIGYVDPQRRSCALCGRPLARKVWQEAIERETMDFCEPRHASLYQTYWQPLYGQADVTAS